MARSLVRNHRSYENTYFESPANTILAYQHQSLKVRSLCEGTVTSYQNFFRKILSLKMGDQLECALDLMRRLPPQNTEENLSQLISLVPSIHEDLVNAVDQPLKVATCPVTKKEYLQSTFNRDGDSFRSPWSNEYDPPITDGVVPSSKTRKLEITANDAFDTYREMYYEGGHSAAYFWDDPGQDGFSGAVLFKKVGDSVRKMKGAWDSIHVFKANERGRKAHYKLTSTVMLYTITSKSELGNLNLSGSMTRQFEADYPFDEPNAHIANIGQMVEDIELKMRNLLQEVYFGKTKDIVNDLRSINSLAEFQKQANMHGELVGELLDSRSDIAQKKTQLTSKLKLRINNDNDEVKL